MRSSETVMLRAVYAVALMLAAAVLVPSLARAQFGAPAANQADMPVDARMRAVTVDSLAAALETRYVFADVGRRTAQALRAKVRKGSYDGVNTAMSFADSLTADLHAIGKDRHFRVQYYERSLPVASFSVDGPSEDELSRAADQSRYRNYGFDRIQRLAGNVGYLDLRMFDDSPEGGAVAMAAMTFLNNTDALIVDLRRNGGGSPNMITLLLSWLFPAGERVHVNDFYMRDGDRTEQFWTLTTLPIARYAGKDVYVVTGPRTASAAEEFSYDIKNLKRGMLIGETTAGGANPGGLVRLNEHFAAFISDGRAINPITKTNWEGVGVTPDVNVKAEEALKTAHVTAVTKLLDQATDAERRALLQRALQSAKDAPVEPLDPGGGAPRRVRITG